MAIAALLNPSPEDRSGLRKHAGRAVAPRRLVERCHIILRSAEGETNEQIAQALGITRQKMARWRGRFAAGSAEVAGEAPAFPFAFHAHERLLAHHGGALFSASDRQPAPARRLSQRAGTGAAPEKDIAQHNKEPKPLIWTAKAKDILAKVAPALRSPPF